MAWQSPHCGRGNAVSLLERLGRGHLDDHDFARLWATGGGHPHLDGCAACRTRLEEFDRWLLGIGDELREDAEAAFPMDRLAAQQAQIVRRLEAMEHPARVLTFPKAARAVISGHSHVRRWVTVAAAAGLIAGVGLAQVLDIHRTFERSSRLSAPVAHITGTTAARGRTSVTTAGFTIDDDFLSDADAFSRPRVSSALLPLEDMTPHAQDLVDRSR
jgi:negative regulator of sigma E activity